MLQFRHDPYELHHFGLPLQREHYQMLEEPPPFVLVPFVLPDPLVWCWEGGRRSMYSGDDYLLIPTVMETISHQRVKELEEEFQSERGGSWNDYASLYGAAHDPVYGYFGVCLDELIGQSDELPYQAVRIPACWPLRDEREANAVLTATANRFEGGPWPMIERYAQLVEEYGDEQSALELAARPIPEGLPADKKIHLELVADQQLEDAAELEELSRTIYDENGTTIIEDADFLVTLPSELESRWQRLLFNRRRALSALPQLIETETDLRIERIHHSWP